MPRARPGSYRPQHHVVAHHSTNSTCTRAITVPWSLVGGALLSYRTTNQVARLGWGT